MNVHLSEESRRFVADQVAAGRYPSEEAVLEDALVRMRQQPQARPGLVPDAERAPGFFPDDAEEPTTATHKPIWEVAADIRASVPEEEWAKLPVDGAEQHDHYVYGTPKRTTAP